MTNLLCIGIGKQRAPVKEVPEVNRVYSAVAIVVDAEALVCCRMRPMVMEPAMAVKTMNANPMLRKNPMSAISFWVAGAAFMMVSLVWGEVVTGELRQRPCMVLETCIHLPFMWISAL
jgi:hypothetical protein